MIIIRKKQMGVFEEFALTGFEQELVEHLKLFEPELCKAAGDEGVRKTVQLCIERAKGYGFTKRGSICFYLELMSVLGIDFDTDPQLYWAYETLGDESLGDENSRTNLLYDRMTIFMDEVIGEDKKHLISALKKLNSLDLEEQAANTTLTTETIIELMASIYPEKVDFVGHEKLSELISLSSSEATDFSLPSPGGTITLASLKLALGHGICRDPLYPWISATLEDHRIKNGDGKLRRLLKKIRVYFLDNNLLVQSNV